MQYDIFLSYQGSNGADVARMMALALTARGYRVYFDYGAKREGEASQEVFAAIDSADVFMLMMTEGVLQAGNAGTDWVRTELFFALSKKKHVVPVGPTNQKWSFPTDLPESIAGVANLQVSRLDMESLFEESIDKIERERFTEEFRVRKTQRAFVPSNLGNSNRNFYGREEELINLRDVLFSGRVAFVTGAAGFGKKSLLRRYGEITKQDYSGGIFQMKVNPTMGWEGAFVQLGESILNNGKTFNAHFGIAKNAAGRDIRRVLLQTASEIGPVLLLAEDVSDLTTLFQQGIYSVFPEGLIHRARIELAVSVKDCDLMEAPWYKEIQLSGIQKTAAVALLLSVCPVSNERERAAAFEVAELLGYQPALLRRVPGLIGDDFAEIMCDSYVELVDLLRMDFDGTIAAACK